MRSVSPQSLAIALAAGLAFPASAQSPTPSLNTTSVGRLAGPYTPIPPGALGGDGAHALLVANDLGMHCANFDSRILSILPPFNVVHAQLVAKGAKPAILSNSAASVSYQASDSATDPALASAPVVAADGSIYKSDAAASFLKTYTALYPTGVLAPFFPTGKTRTGDLGLPVPDLEQLYLGNGGLTLRQQTMPSVTSLTLDAQNHPVSITSRPYHANRLQAMRSFYGSWPLFTKFPFGYAAGGVNWFAAEGIPVAPFDDIGRENPFALMRFQARAATGTLLASTDAVVPVSGETNCKTCHLPAPYGNGLGTGKLTAPTLPTADPRYGHVLTWVSQEWAADNNILALHDLLHRTHLNVGYGPTTGASPKPVLCQTCHYSPALDLAQFGPQATSGGLQQTTHETMSRVMHYAHGILMVNGQNLFPLMPPPNDSRRTTPAGTPINAFTAGILSATCYQCHPGNRTHCLRGTMFAKAGAVCQDCHGQMTQVGNDFSRNLPGGGFILAHDYYTNPNTPRVPWANEPTCGSCHTGDATSNLAGRPGTIAAPDNIRLIQAYLSTDPKATPIVPANARFAEPRVTSGPATGNPQLFRLSVDAHGGVFCEGCHGATHAEWPVLDPNGNDSVTAMELQGHAGKIVECETCHTGGLGATLGGPHGMHPVGKTYSGAWVSAHGDFVDRAGTASCKACHGVHGEGTVLAQVATARTGLPCGDTAQLPASGQCVGGRITLAAQTQVSCSLCHANPIR